MKKNYVVIIKAWKEFVVMGAESEEQAQEMAMDEVRHGWNYDEMESKVIPDEELARTRKNAGEILEDA